MPSCVVASGRAERNRQTHLHFGVSRHGEAVEAAEGVGLCGRVAATTESDRDVVVDGLQAVAGEDDEVIAAAIGSWYGD